MESVLKSFGSFGAVIVDVWRTGVFGVDLGTILSALAVLLAFFVLRGIFTRLVIWRLRRWADRSQSELDDIAVAALEPPLRFVPVVIGVFFAFEVLPLDGRGELIANQLVRSLVAFVIFWIFYRMVDPLRSFAPKLEAALTPELISWLIRGLKVAFIFLGAAAVLEIWGIQVGPILAGLGLFGVAVALGAQDLFRNLIAGMLILGERRFAIGEWIRVEGDIEGTVEAIGFRSTRVRRFDRAPVFVPNAKLADQALINFTRMTHRRIYWIVGVEYRTTIDQLRRIRDGIEAFLEGDPAFARPPEALRFVRIDKFADSSIDIMVYCFTRTTVWGEWLEVKERLAYGIKAVVEEAGTAFAFPSRSIYIATDGGDAPEAFVPPATPGPGEGRAAS